MILPLILKMSFVRRVLHEKRSQQHRCMHCYRIVMKILLLGRNFDMELRYDSRWYDGINHPSIRYLDSHFISWLQIRRNPHFDQALVVQQQHFFRAPLEFFRPRLGILHWGVLTSVRLATVKPFNEPITFWRLLLMRGMGSMTWLYSR